MGLINFCQRIANILKINTVYGIRYRQFSTGAARHPKFANDVTDTFMHCCIVLLLLASFLLSACSQTIQSICAAGC